MKTKPAQKNLPGTAGNYAALPPSKRQHTILHAKVQIDGLPVIDLNLELLGRRAGGKWSAFICDKVAVGINGQNVFGYTYTKAGLRHGVNGRVFKAS